MNRITAAAAAIVLFASPAALAQQANLAGDWTGGYISADGADVNTFDIKMVQAGEYLSGTIVEVNTFGDTSKALFLTSTLKGTIKGAQVAFVKTYDGAGGVTHSVSYRGVLSSDGRRVRGTFDAGGPAGAFEMVR